jgi:hypothetical protein
MHPFAVPVIRPCTSPRRRRAATARAVETYTARLDLRLIGGRVARSATSPAASAASVSREDSPPC